MTPGGTRLECLGLEITLGGVLESLTPLDTVQAFLAAVLMVERMSPDVPKPAALVMRDRTFVMAPNLAWRAGWNPHMGRA